MSGEPAGSPAAGGINLDPYPRIIGLILLVIGIVFGFIAFYFPIHDAVQGAEKVNYLPKAVFACVIFTLAGLAFIVLGPFASRLALKIFGLSGWKKWLVYGLLALPFIGAGELVDYLFRQYLEGFGYKF